MDTINRTILETIKNYQKDKQAQYQQNSKVQKLQNYKIFHKLILKLIKIRQIMKLSFQTLTSAVQLMQRRQIFQYFKNQILSLVCQNQGQILNDQIHQNQKQVLQLNQNQFELQQNLCSESLQQDNKQKYYQNARQKSEWKYSITILYIIHKIIQDTCKKFSCDLWLDNLRINFLLREQILQEEAKILSKINFQPCIQYQSPFEIIQALLNYLKLNNKKQYMLCQYIFELSTSHKPSSFFSFNIKRRFQFIMSTVRLACHFLKPQNWTSDIINFFQLSQNLIDKKCCKLLKLVLQKQKNKKIHSQYEKEQYQKIAKIKLVKIRQSKKEDKREKQQQITLSQQNQALLS